MKKKIVFAFHGIDDLLFYDNNFWYKDLPCIKVYNGGTTQIRCNKFKFSKGLKSIRKLAYRKEIQEISMPF